MAVICERVVILLQRWVDMIDKTLTVHSIPNSSRLERTEHCYEVINAKAKFWPRGNLEFGFLGSFRMCVCVCVCVCGGGGGGGGGMVDPAKRTKGRRKRCPTFKFDRCFKLVRAHLHAEWFNEELNACKNHGMLSKLWEPDIGLGRLKAW